MKKCNLSYPQGPKCGQSTHFPISNTSHRVRKENPSPQRCFVSIIKCTNEVWKSATSNKIEFTEDSLIGVTDESHTDLIGQQIPYVIVSTKNQLRHTVDEDTKNAYWKVIDEGLDVIQENIEITKFIFNYCCHSGLLFPT